MTPHLRSLDDLIEHCDQHRRQSHFKYFDRDKYFEPTNIPNSM